MRRRGLSVFFACVTLLLAPALRAAPRVELLGEPAVAVSPSASLAAASAELSVPSALSPEFAAAPLETDRAIRASLARAVVAEGAKLSALTENMTFAEKSGARLVLLPFDGRGSALLSPDSLAQAEPGENLVCMNWSMAGRDRYALERAGVGAPSAQRLSALALAPVLGHELRHLRLRAEAGRDFPGLREEEILTHLDQAEAAEEVFQRNPDLAGLRPLLDRQFVFVHNAALLERWKRGFGAVADYVLAKYSSAPSLSNPAKNALIARALGDAWRRQEGVPETMLQRIEMAAAFWSDPAAVASVTGLIQARFDQAYARYQRARAARN